MITEAAKQSAAASPFFQEGIVERESGRAVAFAVNVNFELKDGTRERSHGVAIHEVPLLRRRYPDGTVKVMTEWPRGISRLRDLTMTELRSEHARLCLSYIYPTSPTTKRDLVAEVYGASPSEQIRNLAVGMKDVVLAFRALEVHAKQRLAVKYPGRVFSEAEFHGATSEVITPEEMESLVKLIEPEADTLDHIELDPIDLGAVDAYGAAGPTAAQIEAVKKQAEQAADDEQDAAEANDPALRLMRDLVAKGLPQNDAAEVQTLALELPDGITDDLLVRVTYLQKGDGSLHINRALMVRKVIDAWRAGLAK